MLLKVLSVAALIAIAISATSVSPRAWTIDHEPIVEQHKQKKKMKGQKKQAGSKKRCFELRQGLKLRDNAACN
jgi:hypothetical protein